MKKSIKPIKDPKYPRKSKSKNRRPYNYSKSKINRMIKKYGRILSPVEVNRMIDLVIQANRENEIPPQHLQLQRLNADPIQPQPFLLQRLNAEPMPLQPLRLQRQLYAPNHY
jgi:hypothetical protein